MWSRSCYEMASSTTGFFMCTTGLCAHCQRPDQHTPALVSVRLLRTTTAARLSSVHMSSMLGQPLSTATRSPFSPCPTCRPAALPRHRQTLQVRSAAALEAPPMAAAGRVKLGGSDLQVSGMGFFST